MPPVGGQNVDAMLVTAEYVDQLHKMRDKTHMPRWGNGGQRHADAVKAIATEHKVQTVLDYGCGHGMLMEALRDWAAKAKVTMTGYDPGIPGRDVPPAPPFDLVVSTDVLEHVEPECLVGVLTYIRFLTSLAYINVHTGPAKAVLPDGRNAHLIQQPAAWWQAKLTEYFPVVQRVGGFGDTRPSFLCRA